MARPSFTRARLAAQTARFNCSSMSLAAVSLPRSVAELDKFFHHRPQSAAALLGAERVVKPAIKPVKFLVDRMGGRIRLENARFNAGHRLLSRGIVVVAAG